MTQDLTVKSSRQGNRRRDHKKPVDTYSSARKHDSSNRRRRINDAREREAAIY